jgi:hypothetical protein
VEGANAKLVDLRIANHLAQADLHLVGGLAQSSSREASRWFWLTLLAKVTTLATSFS